MCRVASAAMSDAHRQPFIATDGESTVAAPELLAGDLGAGVRVTVALAGVKR